jgi:hypothetical protein
MVSFEKRRRKRSKVDGCIIYICIYEERAPKRNCTNNDQRKRKKATCYKKRRGEGGSLAYWAFDLVV